MYSIVHHWNIGITPQKLFQFQEIIKKLKNKKNEGYDRKEEAILLYCPVADETKYTLEAEGNNYRVKLNENYLMLDSENIWIPFMARFFTGSMIIEEDENDVTWKATLQGNGYYKYYESVMSFQALKLWEPEGTKKFLDKLIGD